MSEKMVDPLEGIDFEEYMRTSKAERLLKLQLWEDIDALTFPTDRWLIDGLIPREGIVILASVAGEKKTWLALEMARSITLGIPFLGYEGFQTKTGNVLYIDAEMAMSEMQRRGRQLGLTSRTKKLYFVNTDVINFNQRSEEQLDVLKEYITRHDIKAVFIDTFRAVAGGLKESDADEVRMFFNRFKPLKDKGVAIIFLEHLRKPNNFEGKIPKKEQLFGSQDKAASVEVVLMLQSGEASDEINVYQRKNRLSKEASPFRVSITDSIDAKGEKRTSLVYAGEVEDKETKKEAAIERILQIVEEGPRTTKELVEILRKEDIGTKNIKDAARELAKSGLVKQARSGREIIYTKINDPKGEDAGVQETIFGDNE